MMFRRITGTALACAGAAVVCVLPARAVADEPCAGWRIDTVAQGLEQLENLEPDGQDGFYLSGDTKVSHVDGGGQVRTVLDNLAAPGGLQLDGTTLRFLTRQDGRLWETDTATGTSAPPVPLPGNGLLRLPDGDLLTTWVGTEGGPSRGVSRYRHDTGAVEPNWSPVPRAEGLALSPDHRTVYTDDLFTGQIYRIPLDDPGAWTTAATLPGLLSGPDDLTMSRAGDLYVAAHVAGTVYRVDPDTGAACAVASGLSGGWTGPSSVRIAPDGDGWALYATLFDGTLRRLRPPADVALAPVPTT
ncbi:SMP-30/gluconolactonase/LRE family protein [Nocardia sp. BMG51109]|uniref:SMP-30/gluconolactonase/LRE family protein n=1 Tax=Nocardia sp. BMG51109 TaxID=1056816 RepID=UPI0004671EC4|nr:SMP-30/gluconolactonase/LRE family protein [Nocardia sp. BMG51109]